jgi:hypothetical protein
MELLDKHISDGLQRAFDRLARLHRLSPEAQYDIARLIDRVFAEGRRQRQSMR